MRWLVPVATIALLSSSALASSHREAPFITKNPKVDGTDFYLFTSYQTGRSNFVTLIANYQPLQENLERLRSATDRDGNTLNVVTLPMPAPVAFEDQRLPASYANFVIANTRVLVPTFNDSADREALGILAGVFPDRQVVGVHARDLVWGLGTLHCLTHEQPA